MLAALPLLLAYTVALAGDDSAKAKAVVPPKPKAPTASAVIAKAAKKTISDLTPHTTYLSRVLKRATSGPALPPRFASHASGSTVVADSIVVEKSTRRMTLFHEGSPVRVYFIALGNHPVGPKTTIGDGRTPEGLYYIAGHNPDSKYHLSLAVSYPNDRDAANARARGVSPGGDIMIHGLPDRFASLGASHRQWDWTEGCIAVTNAEIEEIWSAIPDGALILIKP
jgi:lipoprotein-anchoring transpeptidase ErfK/SrfK